SPCDRSAVSRATGHVATTMLLGFADRMAHAACWHGIPTALREERSMASQTATEAIVHSDKYYWHRYIDTYLKAFPLLGDVRRVVEFGVHHGASIRWLAECFPRADIIGADILPLQNDWPAGHRFSYRQLDQGD